MVLILAEAPSGWSYRLAPHLLLRDRRLATESTPPEHVLVIQGGGAFPPGHPTTRLCLDLLREALAAAAAPRLVDVGCGAGVLALAAAALGVSLVVGIDISRPAARATWKNAQENGLAASLKVVQGSTEALRGPFDLVVANLPWEVQLDKVQELDRLGASGGRLILSGFRDHQEAPLLASYRQLGRSLRRRLLQKFWHPELPPDLSFTWVAWLLQA